MEVSWSESSAFGLMTANLLYIPPWTLSQSILPKSPISWFSSQLLSLTATLSRHMGRCIYGGIYDPENPLSDTHGYRTDVLSALRDLDIPVIRYPGGNFIATYHWQDGVGPRENRPSRPELAWLGTETNQFGT
jgi:hypothetical protein